MSQQAISPVIKAKYSWATKGQLECIQLFCDVVGGKHNLQGQFMDLGGNGVSINQRRSFSTFDDNWLTKLVFMAHDRCIRVELQSAGPGTIRVILFKRVRDGSLMERHPTLDDALGQYRESAIARGAK